MVGKTKAEALKTKKGILDAAVDAFFEKGVAGATLDDIARIAGITRGGVYWYYKNKQEIFLAIHEKLHTSLTDEIIRLIEDDPADPLGAIERFCVDMFRRMRTDESFFKTLSIFNVKCEYSGEPAYLMEEQNRRIEEALAYMTSVFEKAQARGLVFGDVAPSTIPIALACFIEGVVTVYLKNPKMIREQDVPQLLKMFMRGVQRDASTAQPHPSPQMNEQKATL